MACNLKHAAQVGAAANQAVQDRYDTAVRHAAGALDKAAARLSTRVDLLQIALLPHQNDPTVPLPAATRAAFIARLEKKIHAVCSSLDGGSFIGPIQSRTLQEPTIIENVGCTACQGHCCSQGRANNAFLSDKDLVDVQRAHPDQSVSDMVAFYTAALPERSVENACVFQSDQGCTLPRDWRSGVCNTYRCVPLITLSDQCKKSDDLPFVIVAFNDEKVKTVAHRGSVGTETIDADVSIVSGAD